MDFILQLTSEVGAIISCLSYKWGKRILVKSHSQLIKDTVDIWTQSLLPKSILFTKLLSTYQ